MSRSEMTDTEMEAIMDDIVEGLFAVCVTLGMITQNSESQIFVQKFNFDFPRKLSIFWGEKHVKMLWIWTF